MHEDLKWTILTIISIIAATFSILTFKRNKRLENENHLYRIKMDSYSKILQELTTLINRLQDYLKQFKDYSLLDFKSAITNDEINKLAKRIDDLIFAFDESVSKNSLVISKEILLELNLFSLKLFGTEIPEAYQSKQEQLLEKMDDGIAEIIIDVNNINELMRKDLNIDELNLSLFKRIKR